MLGTQALAATAIVLVSLMAAQLPAGYADEVAKFRKEREERLKGERGWLSVAGLHWLAEGENQFGTSPKNRIIFRSGTTPETAGTLTLKEGVVSIQAAPGVSAKVNNDTLGVEPRKVATDADGKPDLFTVGEVQFRIIKRGKRIGLRLYDSGADSRVHFRGLTWYPVKPEFRVVADWVPYKQPKTIYVTNILGDTEPTECPGYAKFVLDGQEIHLEAVDEGDTYFFNFRDRTSGKTTYPAGRFIDAVPPKDGKIVVDFNKSYNPPCAFTKYATCPLPVANNRLKVEIPAGELNYAHD